MSEMYFPRVTESKQSKVYLNATFRVQEFHLPVALSTQTDVTGTTPSNLRLTALHSLATSSPPK